MDVDVALSALVVVVHRASIAQVLLTVLGEARLRAPYADDVAHYGKLLSRHTRVELVPTRDAAGVARRVPRGAFVSLLAADGRTFDSMAFSAFLEQRRQAGTDLAFVIGGPFGAPELERVDQRLSLGPMTLPHQLAWVVLLEQLYRAHKIIAGEPYHY
jgi:23S rRNA (pseudouridine1915-N3)-methyltransferase